MSAEIHVLTYNIHKGYCSGNRRFVLESMRERIAETGADVVFLQEIHGTAIKSAAKRRRFSYPDQPTSNTWRMSHGRILPTAATPSTAKVIMAMRS